MLKVAHIWVTPDMVGVECEGCTVVVVRSGTAGIAGAVDDLHARVGLHVVGLVFVVDVPGWRHDLSAAMVRGRDLASGEHEILGQHNGARAPPVQEPRHMPALHLVLASEIGGTGVQKLRQVPPRLLQRVRVLHEQPVMQVGPNL